MKKSVPVLGMFLLFAGAQAAFADCQEAVSARLKRSLEAKGETYVDIHRQKAEQVVDTLGQSEQLDDSARREIGKLLRSGHYEFYVLDAIRDELGYLDLLVVRKNSCSTHRRYNIYVE